MIYTLVALIAFAANSVLARLALTTTELGAYNFTALRLISGALMLLALVLLQKKQTKSFSQLTQLGSWRGSFYLSLYALSFSVAYLSLQTGTGALILFAAVQITLIFYTLLKGQNLSKIEWLGILLAFSGFIYLVYPSLSTPSVIGFILMALSGIAWAGYTIEGQSSKNPLFDTCGHFIRSLPFALALLIFIQLFSTHSHLDWRGVLIAVCSGAVTSGIGYAIWYRALIKLSPTQAGILQLSVPMIAAIGGFIFNQEQPDINFMIASILILTGILCVILKRTKNTN